jgi:glutathione synthase/RimK-type ligase-like ATP-grasp enzyme
MIHLAILTSERVPDLLEYDQQLVVELSNYDIIAEPIVWETQKEKLKNYEAAIFRTTWGYHEKYHKFLLFLDYLDSLKIPIFNPVRIIRKNLHKFYLRELPDVNIPIIDTVFVDKNSGISLKSIISEKKWDKFIIKPAVSAGAYRTHLINDYSEDGAEEIFRSMNLESDLLIQKYILEIKTDGEWSTIFFNRDYHYTVNKIPKHGDFRVQTLFDGKYTVCNPPENILEISKRAAELFLDECLYVRVDGVRSNGQFLIMEIEMIEPDIYLDYHPEGIPIFAKSIAKRLNQKI